MAMGTHGLVLVRCFFVLFPFPPPHSTPVDRPVPLHVEASLSFHEFQVVYCYSKVS